MHLAVPTLIIEPTILFREGLRLLLEQARFEPVWCSDVPPDGPPLALHETAPLLIVGSAGDAAQAHIAAVRAMYPAVRVVLLVDAATPDQIAEALHSGAATLMPRHSSTETLVYTLRLVCEGAAVFPRDMVRAMGSLPMGGGMAARWQDRPGGMLRGEAPCLPADVGLSEREMGVLMWLRDGLPNKEIARRMAITEATVKVHVKAILRKARMRNRTQVASWASRHGVPGGEPAAALQHR